MQLTDFQYLLPKKKCVILCKQMCFVPISPIFSCRVTYYDGAANMTGIQNTVAVYMCAEEPHAMYTHCYGHALNLAASDTVKKNKILNDVLDTVVLEITKLLKFSPKCDSLFTKLKQGITPGTHEDSRILYTLLNRLDSSCCFTEKCNCDRASKNGPSGHKLHLIIK